MILADKIIALRKQKGWSQEELAHQLGVSRQAVSKWESAASIPDLDKILGLSQLFDVSTDYLLKEEIQEALPDPAPEAVSERRSISLKEADRFLHLKAKLSKWMAGAIAAMILSPELLIFLGGASETGMLPFTEDQAGAIGAMVLLCIIGLGVVVLLITDTKLKEYEPWKSEPVQPEYGVEGMAEKRKEEFAGVYGICNAVGVFLCIICAIPLFVGVLFQASEMTMILCVNLLLFLIAVAVFLFVWAGENQESYLILLQEGEFSLEEKTERSRMEWIGKAYWCITTALYLGISFWSGAWGRTWIVWPCAGVLYGAIHALGRMWNQKKG